MERTGVYLSQGAKTLYKTEDPNLLVMAWDGPDNEVRTAYIPKISNWLFRYLNAMGIPTNFREELSANSALVDKVKPLPVKVMVRRVVSGDLVTRCNMPKAASLASPLKELRFRESKPEKDALVTREQLIALRIMTAEDIDTVERLAGSTVVALVEPFAKSLIDLADCVLSFGRIDKKIVVMGEISPMTCRLWGKDGCKFGRDCVDKGITNANLHREIYERLAALSCNKIVCRLNNIK